MKAKPHHNTPATPRPIAYSGLWHTIIYPNPTHATLITQRRIPAWKRAHLN
jgi:hypothetical protein